MDVKNKIEDNLIIWFTGIIVASFLSGLAAYEGIIKIAKLEVVTQIEIKVLREDIKKFEELQSNCGDIKIKKKSQIENGLKKFHKENIQ